MHVSYFILRFRQVLNIQQNLSFSHIYIYIFFFFFFFFSIISSFYCFLFQQFFTQIAFYFNEQLIALGDRLSYRLNTNLPLSNSNMILTHYYIYKKYIYKAPHGYIIFSSLNICNEASIFATTNSNIFIDYLHTRSLFKFSRKMYTNILSIKPFHYK
jgi:hypothetical protein